MRLTRFTLLVLGALFLAQHLNATEMTTPGAQYSPEALAKYSAPTVKDLVTAIVQHHPEFRVSLARTAQAEGLQQLADAAFDTRILQESLVRPTGYYDGAYAKQSVVQPIAAMNGEIFGSYRISDGEFPVYEAESDTLDLGEASMGVRLSLLQNREIDKRRLELRQATWVRLAAQAKQDVELNKLIYAGVSAYLNWYQSYRQLNVIEELVRITRNRFSGIEARVESGDLAEISLTEFRSTLLQREMLQREAEQRLELARYRLAYFWRLGGQTTNPDVIGQPPADIDWPFKPPSLQADTFEDDINGHPSIAMLRAKTEQTRNKQRLARNEILPQLDLELKVARDLGDGLEPLTGTESIVGVSFSMPLGQRAARARESIAAAELREYDYETQVVSDKLRRDIGLALEGLSYSRRILTISQDQEAVAQRLQLQEQSRFEAGVSDLFLLITRETAALQAQLKSIDAEINVMREELALQATLARLLPQP